MMYSAGPMEEHGEVRDLEEKVSELERVADSLGRVPDEELVGTLDRAVELLREVNASLEASLEAAGEESRDIGTLIEGLRLEPFDEALAELEPDADDA
jgi:hypothetical protein